MKRKVYILLFVIIKHMLKGKLENIEKKKILFVDTPLETNVEKCNWKPFQSILWAHTRVYIEHRYILSIKIGLHYTYCFISYLIHPKLFDVLTSANICVVHFMASLFLWCEYTVIYLISPPFKFSPSCFRCQQCLMSPPHVFQIVSAMELLHQRTYLV